MQYLANFKLGRLDFEIIIQIIDTYSKTIMLCYIMLRHYNVCSHNDFSFAKGCSSAIGTVKKLSFIWKELDYHFGPPEQEKFHRKVNYRTLQFVEPIQSGKNKSFGL